MRLGWVLGMAGMGMGPVAGAAEWFRGHQSQVRLFYVKDTPGNQELGLQFKMNPDWHIYWQNPGDSGASPKLTFKNARMTEWRWPVPVRLPVPPLTNIGYPTEVVFPLKVESQGPARDVELGLEYLICKVECVPVFTTLTPTLESNPALLEKYRALSPAPVTGWKIETQEVGPDDLSFTVAAPGGKMLKELDVFPFDGDVFRSEAPELTVDGKKVGAKLRFVTNRDVSKTDAKLLVVATDTAGERHIFENPLPLHASATQVLLQALLLAFLGGLILNLMPCVLPVLSLKILELLRESDPARIRRASWAYAAGVLTSFGVLGLLLILLRLSGSSLGWGFQLQSPPFVLALALLFFVMALNFANYFEAGNSLVDRAARLGRGRWLSGSFGTGVLAVFVASPCTAPFMGTALGVTLVLPPVQALLVFLLLGAGLAAPMVAVAYAPFLLKYFPKPGVWMVRLKEFMAFPLFATACWLVWVLTLQRGANAALVVLLSFTALSFALWIQKNFSMPRLGWLLVLASVALPFVALRSIPAISSMALAGAENEWHPFDQATINEVRKTRPVFIDFTASWCITCQVNKLTVLHTDKIAALFREKNVYLVKADWTNRDARITEALAGFGRNSVPVYVYHEPGKGPKVLPEILTPDIIGDLFKTEGASP